jgi:hypothetical protein
MESRQKGDMEDYHEARLKLLHLTNSNLDTFEEDFPILVDDDEHA